MNITMNNSISDIVSDSGGYDILSFIVVAIGIITMVVGIPTNIGLIASIILSPQLRTLNNVIIANITLSGLLQLVTVIPWQFHSFLTGKWLLPDRFCYVTFLLALITVDALVNNMAVLAIYRYFVVVRRRNYILHTKRVVVSMVAAAWLISVVVSSVLIAGFVETEFVPAYGRCVPANHTERSAKIYKLITVGGISKCFIPVIWAYLRIFWEVRRSSRSVNNANSRKASSDAPSTSQDLTSGSRKTRKLTQREVTITFVCAVNFMLFSCCYGPIVIVLAVYDSKGEMVPGGLHKVCTLMYWIGNTLNPLSYAILQRETRKVLFSPICRAFGK